MATYTSHAHEITLYKPHKQASVDDLLVYDNSQATVRWITQSEMVYFMYQVVFEILSTMYVKAYFSEWWSLG